MKKLLLFFMGVAICISSMYSQAVLQVFPDWTSTTGSQNFFIKNVTKTFGANIYVVGATLTGSGDYDMLVAKYSQGGALIWERQYDGTAHFHDVATAVYVDASSNVYITGEVVNDATYHTSDVITVKYNSSGTQQWATTYNGTGSLNDAGSDLTVDASGNVYVSGGSYNNAGTPNKDMIALKYNSSGTQQWVGRYDGASHLDDAATRISVNATTVTITGAVQTATTTYQYGVIAYAIATGVQTSATITTGGTSGIANVTDVVKDASGNIYIAGSQTISGHGLDYCVVKINASMAIQWTVNYNGSASLDDEANGLRVDASGNVFVTGYSKTSTHGKDFATLKYNSSGTLQWTQTYNDSLNGDDEASAMAIDASGNIYVTGSATTDSLNLLNYYTVKYNTSGTQQWKVITDGDAHLNDKATDIAVDTTGLIVVTGQSQLTPTTYQYLTVRYIEKNIITPTDFNGEKPQTGFDYIQNKGQLVATDFTAIPDVKYYSFSNSPELFVKNNSFSMVFAHADTTSAPDSLHRIDVTFNQVLASAKTYAMNEQDYYLNYYLPQVPKGVTEIHPNQRLVTTGLYANIDLEYSSNTRGVKYYFIVKPGGSPTAIQIEFTGASSFALSGTTNKLTINSSVGSITFDRPTVYQLSATNTIIPITGWTADWQTNGASNKYKFNIGTYDNTKPLIIMVTRPAHSSAPPNSTANLCWSTYFGGANEDYVKGIDLDIKEDQFVAGQTFSANLPTTSGAFQVAALGGYDAFLFKFKANHQRLWGTYIGGSGNDNCSDVKVRRTGNGDPYVVGSTPSSDFPFFVKSGAHNDSTLSGTQDGFIAQFANITGFKKWITLFGGAGIDWIYSLDFDGSNRMFIAGKTGSSSGITSVVPTGAYTQAYAGGFDAYLARFTPADTYDWYTPYGGTGADIATNVKVDKYGGLFIYGETASPTGAGALPTTNPVGAGDYYDNTLGGSQDAFIAKFDYGGAPLWATYIGGSGLEYTGRNALDFDGYNDIYIGGCTTSTDFTMKNSGGYFDNSFSNNYDGFLMKISGANYDTLWSTYIGSGVSTNNTNISAIAIDGDNEVFVGGTTEDASFPLYNLGGFFYQNALSGTADGSLMCFDQWNREILGTYYGGYDLGNQEQIFDMVLTGNHLYAGGHTFSIDTNSVRRFPLFNSGAPAYYDTTYNGGSADGFVSMFCIGGVTGIHESNSPSNDGGFILYPNPASEELTIKLSKELNQNAIVELYSIDGKLVYSYVLLKYQEFMNMNVTGLSTGLYFIRIRNAEFNSAIKFSKN